MPGGTDWENKTKGSTIRKFQVILDQSTAEPVIVTEISATIELRRHHKRSTGNRVAIRRNRRKKDMRIPTRIGKSEI